MIERRLLAALLAGFCFNVHAQSETEESPYESATPWGLGLAAAVTDSAYAGEGTRVLPVPLISYQGERFYFRGVTAGWVLLNRGGFELSAVANARLDGFDVNDLGRSELSRNGIDIDTLEDRDNGLDAGLSLDFKGRAGALELKVLNDVSDASGGTEVAFQYGYPMQAWKGVLTPIVAARWLSDDMADYYYGTLDSEVARGAIDYRPGAATLPRVGVTYMRPLGDRWSLITSAHYEFLPSEFKASPLVEAGADGAATVFIGVSRGFRTWWMWDQ